MESTYFRTSHFVDPKFIGAETISLLQRLQQAKQKIENNSYFTFVTIHRISDQDPLAKLISGIDKSLLIDKLFIGKTDKSEMGKVRKLWREHLNLSSDEELRSILKGFRVFESHRSLDELRSQINIKAQVAGLLTCSNSSDFRYDELARQLKVKKLNNLTKDVLKKFCEEEGLFQENFISKEDLFLQIAVRSFIGISADLIGATAENTLLLTEHFNERYLKEGTGWQLNIRPKVSSFINNSVAKSTRLRISMDAHASIAFLIGSLLHLKSSVEVELIQKGRVGARIWSAGILSAEDYLLPRFTHSNKSIGQGKQIAIAINISHKVDNHALSYIAANLPDAGKLISFDFPGGPGQQSIRSGAHAVILSEQVTQIIRELKDEDTDTEVHVFTACPNAFLFYLGQQSQGISPCIIYEYDFDRKGNKTYHPSFLID